MEKFFQAIKRLRPGVQSGKVSREQALRELIQESGVSEDIAETAIKNMTGTQPEVPGGITSLKPDVTFTPTQKELPEPIDMTVEERTGGLIKDQESGAANVDPSIMTLGDEDAFKYEMAQYRQRRQRKMEPVYKQYGAVTERDRSLVDEYVSLDSEDNIILSSSNPKYDKATASIFIQESAEEAAGQAGSDIAANILYGRPAENILVDEGLDAYIDYAFKELKKEGLTFNRNLLKRVLKEKYGAKDTPDGFANGGRIGFADGVGRKGILSALADKLNEIAPGSTGIGKTTKAMSETAKRKRAEEEMFKNFAERNPIKGEEPNTRIVEREKIDVDIGTIEDFYDDFVQAGGDPSVSLKDLQQAYDVKKSYPFNTPYINKKGKLIGGEATQKMYPESKKFYIEDEDVLSQRITDIREGRTPKAPDATKKAGQGRFTKAEVLENIINNTIKNLGDDPEVGEYVRTALPNILKEIKAKPELANNENVFRNLTTQFANNPNQRLVVYDDDTVDFFTRGEKRGMGSVKALADEFGISMEEAAKIKMMEPEDQVLEIQRRRALNKRKLNASGGLNYLMGM